MRPALKPGLLVVWRDRDTLQIGIDPRRAIALTGMAGVGGLLGLLDGSRDQAQVLAAAQDLGIPEAAADRVLALLAAAGALQDFPAAVQRCLPGPVRRRLAPELATAALAHGDTDGGARILARRQAAWIRVHGTGIAGLSLAGLLTAAGIGRVTTSGRLAAGHDPAGPAPGDPATPAFGELAAPPGRATGARPLAAGRPGRTLAGPAQAQPAQAQPAQAQPAQAQPPQAQPAQAQPPQAQPPQAQPAQAQPAQAQPPQAQPAQAQPAQAQPAQAQPAQAQPAQAQPAQAQPAQAQPAQAQPARNQPARNQPARNQPARNQPARNQPTRNQPARTQPPAAGTPPWPGTAQPGWPAAGELPPGLAAGASPALARPDLVVLAGLHHPEIPAMLVRARVPHLALAAGEAIGTVGPLVQPGRSACLRCLDLARADRDPAWPLILAQVAGHDPEPAACDTILATAVAAQAAAQVLHFTDRAEPASAVTNGTLELVLPSWQWRRRSWAPHRRCGCGRRAGS
jgi:hypothetical protein